MTTRIQYHGAACKTCRRRGRKCTRELPTCQSCRDRGLECEGYVLKWAGLASRGYLVGKDASKIKSRSDAQARKSNRNTTRPQRLHRIQPENDETIQDQNDTEDIIELPGSGLPSPAWTPSDFQLPSSLIQDDLFENYADGTTDLPNAISHDIEIVAPSDLQRILIPAPRCAMNFFEIPPDLAFILNYHVHEVAAKLCVDNNASTNPYRQYIYPLALQKPALLYACAAMSSVHYSTCQQNDAFYVDALRLRGKALSRLQESMWSGVNALDEDNLATILMLILCDMCMGGHSNFEMYFTFAKSLIDIRAPMRTQNSFIEQYISWLDIMSSASTSRKPAFSLTDVKSLRTDHADWSYDVVPCAADIFDILLEIVDLYKNNSDSVNLANQINALKERVLTSPPHTERGMPWYHLTEAYRYAVLLYTLLLFETDSDEDEVIWLVSSIMQHAKSAPSQSGWSDQLLWPLFHAGLKMTNARWQDWLRDKFREMQLSGGFRNVTSAQETLEKVWNGQFSGRYIDLLEQEGIGDMLLI